MIDLSHELRTAMPVYPGDPEVAIADALTLERDGVAVSELHLGSHSGTHLDAPSHTVQGGRTLAEVSLDELVGEALIIHAEGVAAAGRALTAGELGLDALTEVPRIVAIATGWHRHFGTPAYLEHPFIDKAAAEKLWQLGMRVLVVDTLSPDQTPSADFPVHAVVLGQDGLIVENARGLDALGDRERLGIFPLRLGAVDGAPVRAVAF
ncbi:cyclase family protein [Leucobacter sp. UCMA 4100]|uniref:cyclase family protein n=1 Tax=Leucobacter sp. UCMA 4100 TaxID=2810534 RepID=UPI0022EA57F4|nr:cyclase family protein [Leucobacter sp. UCMA 4100]MDA3146795.1 cyclase family protein [Leucobacter sp. UCMA 4100]